MRADLIALKSAEKALRPFYNAVFNDNGDITVTGGYAYEEAVAGYFAYRKVEAALTSLSSPQEPAEAPYAYEYGRSNGDGTFSICIERGEPRNPVPAWPVTPLFTSPVVPIAAKSEAEAMFEIEHDGFKGSVLKTPEGHPCIYVTREGKRGRVLQQIGTKVVHVYGEKWLKPATPTREGEGQ